MVCYRDTTDGYKADVALGDSFAKVDNTESRADWMFNGSSFRNHLTTLKSDASHLLYCVGPVDYLS